MFTPKTNPKIIPKDSNYLRFPWWGAVFRRVALFYRVRPKHVIIAMGNEHVDFGTLHFHIDFNEIPSGPARGPQDTPRLHFEVPKHSQGRPWGPHGRPETPQ